MTLMKPLDAVIMEKGSEEEHYGFNSNWCWLVKAGVKSWKSFSVVQ